MTAYMPAGPSTVFCEASEGEKWGSCCKLWVETSLAKSPHFSIELRVVQDSEIQTLPSKSFLKVCVSKQEN